MSRRCSLVVLLAALSCAQPQIEPGKRLPYVIVARADLYPGVPIGEDDLYAIGISPLDVPEAARTHLFHDPAEVVGHFPHERILADELVRRERIAVEGVSGFNAQVPQGMRAFAVPFSVPPGQRQNFSGWLPPGTRVDVVVTIDEPQRMTLPLVGYAAVIGVMDGAVIIAVTPYQAEHLAHALRVGRLSILGSKEPPTHGIVPIGSQPSPPSDAG